MTIVDRDMIEASSATDVLFSPRLAANRLLDVRLFHLDHDPADGIPRPNDDKVPRRTPTVMASQALANDWTISGTWACVDEMAGMGEGDAVKRLSRLDAELAKRLRLPDGDWVWSLNVQNLFDDDHDEFEPPSPTVPQPGNRAEPRIFLVLKYLLR